jgi:hypothetical protein
MSMKNCNDTSGNRTRDLPACRAMPQKSAPPRISNFYIFKRVNGKTQTLYIYIYIPLNNEPVYRSHSVNPTCWIIRCLNICRDKKYFSFPKCPDRLLGPTQTTIRWVPGSVPGVKRPGPEFNNSPSSSEKVKNEWGNIYAAPICLHVVDRDKFILSIFTPLKPSG